MIKFIKYRFTIILVTLLLMLIIPPYISDISTKKIIIYILTTIILLCGILFVDYQQLNKIRQQKRKKRGLRIIKIASFIVLITVLLNWVEFFNENTAAIVYTRHIFILCIFIILFGLIIKYIFVAKNVTADVISGTISGYIFLGIISAYIFQIISFLYPNSFNIDPNLTIGFQNYIYFAFVTITSLGFGDIVPLIPESKIIVSLVAIAGQMYTAIVIALIIGKYIYSKTEARKNDNK